MRICNKAEIETEDNSMTDNTNKGFWERMARIYTAFMSKKRYRLWANLQTVRTVYRQ